MTIAGRRDDLVIESKAFPPRKPAFDSPSTLVFTRGPLAHRDELDSDAVTVFMDDDAAWYGQVLSESDVQRLIAWLLA